MKIADILSHIDNGYMALPKFQRGYVWNRDQVKTLFDSLYRRHPIGGLLVWVTESSSAEHRGDNTLAPGMVKLLLDGQQRMTSLYGVIRGQAPAFFEGNDKAFTDLQFNMETEEFSFYQPVKMKDNPFWINVTQLMIGGNDKLGEWLSKPALIPQFTLFIGRLSRLLGIKEIDLHIEEITGPDKTLDVVVDIFNRVNSGGTKLSKGDLALAKICADWPEARDRLNSLLLDWSTKGFSKFTLDWLLRSVNTVLNGEAKFEYLQKNSSSEVQNGLTRATKHINTILNLISDRLGLDHDAVFFGAYTMPVMAFYLDRHQGSLSHIEQDKLLFWYVQAAMRGRYSGSTESAIDADLNILEVHKSIDDLLEALRLQAGVLRVEPAHFAGWSLGARFYPVLYMLTRMAEAKDFGTGMVLSKHLLGANSTLDVHHIFPKAQLYKKKRVRSEVNALANLCFLTKDTNIKISDRLPEDYFSEIEEQHPGALASQWIPADKALWKIENYFDFLEERKRLLAEEFNSRMKELLHGDDRWLEPISTTQKVVETIEENIETEDEERQLEELNRWVIEQGIKPGVLSYDFSDPDSGEQKAVFDLAWPEGIQAQLSQPVAVLLNEPAEVIATASQAGYQCFTDIQSFKQYIVLNTTE
ncbi:MAG: DUF262 domain-containing protein [Desulfovibrionaceae bacterium]|nr:DUF262 domain-containing protein [Desulfovibrionaceae bacterium]